MTTIATRYIDAVVTAGGIILAIALTQWQSDDLVRFSVFLALFAAAATLKFRIRGITGTYSPMVFFVLIGAATLTFSEVAVAALLGGVVQCIFRAQRRPLLIQVWFNAANGVISSASAVVFVRWLIPGFDRPPLLIAVLLGAIAFYLVNTGLVSVVLALVDGQALSTVWKHWCVNSLPYYILGALIVGVTLSATNPVTLIAVILAGPPILLVTLYRRTAFHSAAWTQSQGVPHGQ